MLENNRLMSGLKGFVMARELIDDDGKLKWFAFYPRESHGLPPYLGKSRSDVLRIWLRSNSIHRDSYKRLGNKLPDNDREHYAVMPIGKVIYLDRY